MTTALYSHASALLHETPRGHPERTARYQAIVEALDGARFAGLERRDAPLADPRELLRCHPESYVALVRDAIPGSGFVALDPDTHVSAGSWEPAMRATGGIVAAVDAVVSGEIGNAFVAMRPPGHHAEAARAMGFCLFGNVAIATKHALDHLGLDRVAVVDFDVHHGNGTQALLWTEARALYCSSHQMPHYPGSGEASERGAHGNVVNVPLKPHSDGATMRQAYETTVFPAIEAFAPDLILISAGFDAHTDDPLAQLDWTTADFAWLTRRICQLADDLCDGRVVSTLEGGYDLQALATSAAAHVSILMEASQ